MLILYEREVTDMGYNNYNNYSNNNSITIITAITIPTESQVIKKLSPYPIQSSATRIMLSSLKRLLNI